MTISVDTLVWNQQIKNYTTTTLVRWLHNGTPRTNHEYKHVTNEFDASDMNYLEGVGMGSALAVYIALITFFFFLIRCVIKCFQGCKGDDISVAHEHSRSKCLLISFAIAGMIVFGGIGYGFYANQIVTEGVLDVRNALLDMQTAKDSQVTSARAVVTLLNAASNDSTKLLEELRAINSSSVYVPSSVITDVANIQLQLANPITSLNSAINTYDDIDINKYANEVKKGDSIRWSVQVSVLIMLAIPFLLVYIAYATNSNVLLFNVIWIGVCCSILGWLLTGVETSVILFMSDVCFDPSGYLAKTANSSGSASGVDYVTYFTVCVNTSSPFDDDFNSATKAIAQSRASINDLDAYVNQLKTNTHVNASDIALIEGTMNNLTVTTNLTQATVDVLFQTLLKCNRVHNNYVDSLDGVCHNVLEGFSSLVVIQGAVAALLLVPVFLGISRTFDEENDAEPQRKLTEMV
eukprot:c10390_g1_i1.p1 GENE.c10390_g1_i1~~c10390_g1_i1.p1  ORF type:complete len:464 (+),score=121.66 c10390_g1_i1:187-1578(+)